MIIGKAQFLLNHPVIFIGSTAFPSKHFSEAGISEAVVSSSEHVLIAARHQVAPVSVTIWQRIWPGAGHIVFDSDLDFADTSLAIFDLDNLTRYTRSIGTDGVHRLSISVDDLEKASRIHVVVDPGEKRLVVGSAAGYELPSVSGISGDSVPPATELNFLLAEHDRPMSRLVAALKLIFSEQLETSRRDTINLFRVQLVVEWIRWLSPELTLEYSKEMGALITARLKEGFRGGYDEAAILLATRIMELVRKAG